MASRPLLSLMITPQTLSPPPQPPPPPPPTPAKMAAAAAVAVGTIFSVSSTPCLPPKRFQSDPFLLCIRSYPVSSSSSFPGVAAYSHHQPAELLSSHKWRLSRILAAVAEAESGEVVAVEEPAENVGIGEEGEVVNTKLYFGNLPYSVDSAQLAGIIQVYGSPEMVEVLYDRVTGKSRGFAFVTMSSVEDCNAVIENLDGSEYGGRTMRVNFADKPKPKEPLYPETEYKIFVGNLAWTVTSDSLTEVFQEYGHVVGARVLFDGETGRSRGYGFVCYETQQEMDAALEYLNGAELEGRPLRVSPALGKRS